MSTGNFHSLGHFEAPGLAPRGARAYVPQGRAPTRFRPVLVLLDGQNVFGDEGSFAGGWHAHEATDRLLRRRTVIAPVVLAVDHGNEKRLDELSAWKVQGDQGGGAEAFFDWLTQTLLPRARTELGLNTDPRATFIGGSSMGGLGSLYAHFRHPDVFGGALCMSSSFFVGEGGIFQFLASRPNPPHSRIYLDAGQKEAGGRLASMTVDMAGMLRSRGYDESRLKLRIDPRGTHSERHWRRRLPGALRFLLGPVAAAARARSDVGAHAHG